MSLSFQKNDFVRFTPRAWRRYSQKSYTTDNIFEVKSVSENGYTLDVFDETIPAKYLEPVPIDGKSDSMVYYDPIVAASLIGPNEAPPVHHTNYQYYMDAFKKSFYSDGQSMYEIVKKRMYRYVHEVQRWLRKDYGWEDLKIRHHYKPLPEVYAQQLWGYRELFLKNGVRPEMFLPELSNILYIKFASQTKGGISLPYSWDKMMSVDKLLNDYSADVRALGQNISLTSEAALRDIVRYVNDIDINLFGSIYEGLLDRFSVSEDGYDVSANKIDTIQTVVKVLSPNAKESVGIFCSGTGRSIIELSRQKGDGDGKAFGEAFEIDKQAAWISMCNILFHGVNCILRNEDVVRVEHAKYDSIICRTPLDAAYSVGRNSYPVRTKNRMLNYVQEVLTSLSDSENARAAILLTNGFYADDRKEFIAVKEFLFSHYSVSAILRLPSNIAQVNRTASVLFLNKNPNPSESIWVFDATTSRKISYDKLLNRFLSGYIHPESRTVNRRWLRINLDTIRESNYCFQIGSEKDNGQELSPQEALDKAIKLSKEVTSLLNELRAKLT